MGHIPVTTFTGMGDGRFVGLIEVPKDVVEDKDKLSELEYKLNTGNMEGFSIFPVKDDSNRPIIFDSPTGNNKYYLCLVLGEWG